MSKVSIYRVSCRACDKEFKSFSLKDAKALHAEHIKTCDTILVLEKIEQFRKEGEKILGRKVTFEEAAELLGIKYKGGKT